MVVGVKTVVVWLDAGYLTARWGAAKEFSHFFAPLGPKSAISIHFCPSLERFLHNLSLDNGIKLR
jgi:hypothetical protein